MLDIRNSYLITMLVYTSSFLVLLIAKDWSNHREKKSLNVYNVSMIIFLTGLIDLLFLFNASNKEDLNCFSNIFMAKYYCFYLVTYMYLIQIYMYNRVFNLDVYPLSFKNKLSGTTFILYLITLGFVMFGSTEFYVNGTVIWFSGVSYHATVFFIFFLFCHSLFIFFKYRKTADYFKCLPVLLFPIFFGVGTYIFYRFGFSSFEIVIAFLMVFVYFSIEKREESIQKDIMAATIDIKNAAKFKSDFLSSMSHEIKTPLNSILYSTRNIGTNNKLNSNERKQINNIIYSSDELKETVSNILLISKIEIDKLSMNKISYDIREEVGTLPFSERMKIDSHNINYFMDINKNVPTLLKGEKEIVRSILDNSLSYAFSKLDNGSLSLKVDWDEPTGNLVLEIFTINGSGKKIYEDIDYSKYDIYDSVENDEFSQGMACILINKLNGKFNTSYDNGRNTFTIIIKQEKDNVTGDFKNKSYAGKKALVVDDVKLNLKIAKKVLESLDFTCDYIESGFDCIDYVKNNQYDIIFLDIMMPNMSGEETLARLKEDNNFSIPVIALTADDAGGAYDKYISEGFKDVIIKPFTNGDVVNAVDKIFGGDK